MSSLTKSYSLANDRKNKFKQYGNNFAIVQCFLLKKTNFIMGFDYIQRFYWNYLDTFLAFNFFSSCIFLVITQAALHWPIYTISI